MTHSDSSSETHRFQLWPAVAASLVAGLVFIVLEMILVPVVGGGSPFGPPAMISAIALGPDGVLPEPGTAPAFVPWVFISGLIVHFVLSIVLGLIFAAILSFTSLGMGAALASGVIFGIVVYIVNFFGLTAVFPWFAMARTIVTLVTHIVFGFVLAWVYVAMSRAR